jgi:ribosomal protein S18 acetylase RimI-like enzyme
VSSLPYPAKMHYLDLIMPSASPGVPQVKRWKAGDPAQALDLALARVGANDRSRHATIWSEALAQGRAALWISQSGDRVIGAILAELAAGRTAHVQAPQVLDGEEAGIVRARLLQAACGDLAATGVRIVQALETVDHGDEVDALVAEGFRHVNDLLYLVSLRGRFPSVPGSEPLELIAYNDAEPDRMAGVIVRTYAGSLDCPELGNLRPIDEVLAGYRAVGQFDPARWLIARENGRDVGCLLLGRHDGDSQMELIYLGVVPEARGRGLGAQLVCAAQRLAGEDDCQRLVTAVDAANQPAIAVYAAAGFVAWDRRSVYLRVL